MFFFPAHWDLKSALHHINRDGALGTILNSFTLWGSLPLSDIDSMLPSPQYHIFSFFCYIGSVGTLPHAPSFILCPHTQHYTSTLYFFYLIYSSLQVTYYIEETDSESRCDFSRVIQSSIAEQRFEAKHNSKTRLFFSLTALYFSWATFKIHICAECGIFIRLLNFEREC